MAHRDKFVTERAIIQYFGLIKNNMVDIEAKRHIDTPRERKLFYQVTNKPVFAYVNRALSSASQKFVIFSPLSCPINIVVSAIDWHIG